MQSNLRTTKQVEGYNISSYYYRSRYLHVDKNIIETKYIWEIREFSEEKPAEIIALEISTCNLIAVGIYRSSNVNFEAFVDKLSHTLESQ